MEQPVARSVTHHEHGADIYKDNVYFTWSRFQGFGNNAIYVSRSTNHGATFSRPIKISDGIHGNQTTDIAVAPNGHVYVTWRQFNDPSPQETAIVFSKSTNGGLTWSKPRVISEIDPFDSREFSGSSARDCGDGPFACPTGFVFRRQGSQPSIAANAGGVYVVYNEEQASGQSKVMVVRSTDNGATWSAPVAIDPATLAGHEWWPDIAATSDRVSVAYYTSRDDTGYSADRPPCNSAGGTSTCNGLSGVNVYYTQSTDNGVNWDVPTRISDQAHNPNYEMFGNRDVPFHGDYIYISMVGPNIYVAWTDNRDVLTGNDPRYGPPDGTDGFDVLQCRVPTSTSPDQCPNKGGLNQNIYATRVAPQTLVPAAVRTAPGCRRGRSCQYHLRVEKLSSGPAWVTSPPPRTAGISSAPGSARRWARPSRRVSTAPPSGRSPRARCRRWAAGSSLALPGTRH